MQETCLKSLRGFADFEPESNFKVWVLRILRNTYLTSRSGLAARRTVALEDELDDRSESGSELYPESAVDMDVAYTGAYSLYIEGIRRTNRLCGDMADDREQSGVQGAHDDAHPARFSVATPASARRVTDFSIVAKDSRYRGRPG